MEESIRFVSTADYLLHNIETCCKNFNLCDHWSIFHGSSSVQDRGIWFLHSRWNTELRKWIDKFVCHPPICLCNDNSYEVFFKFNFSLVLKLMILIWNMDYSYGLQW